MGLNVELVSQFAKLTANKKETKKESTAWGEVVEITASGKTFVKLDGSDRVTPVETITEVKVGDRVSVTIKNHAATLTGNTSSPSINADGSTVGTIKNDFKNLSADNVLIREKLTAGEAYISELTAKNVKIEETLEAHTGKFANLEADVAEFERLSATFATFEQLTAKEAEFRTLLTDYATVENLSATNAKITSLETEDAKIRNLFADYAKIADLEADYAKITELDTVKGNITTLNSDVATINKALVGYATIAQLEAGYATIASLNAVDAKVGNLNADVADINTLIFGGASGTSIQTSFANAVVAQLGDAQIKSAMIESISAGKITAGDIITNNVKVKSNDGKLLIADQTIQISDNTRVRVQIGKDAANDYSINIWDANGKLMFSEGGLTEDAVKEQIIRNDMVKDDANISASKLDIDTLFDVINEDGSHTLKSNKIKLDEENQTLDVAFGALITKVDGISVGGRNLIAGTSLGTVYSGVSNPDLGYKDVWSAKTINTPTETEYIVSFDAKADAEIDIRCFFFSPNTTLTSESSTGDRRGNAETAITDGVSVVHITTEWKRYWVKWTQTPADAKKNVIIGRHSNLTNRVYIRAVKLEAGTMATDWTPAPEDVDGALTTLDSKYSSLKVTVDGLSSTVATQNQTIASKADGSTVETLSSNYSTLSQTVNGLTSTVGQHTTQIASKADGSTVTAVSNKMTTLESNLEGFKSTVSEIYTTKSDFNNLASRVSTAETGLAQTKDDLTLYAKKTDVTQTLSGYYTASQTDAKIKVSSDAITQKVSSLETEFDNLSIGGRNSLLNTGGGDSVVFTNGATVRTSGITSSSNVDGVQTLNCSASGALEVYYRFMSPIATDLYGLEPGETYIISGKAKVSTTSGTFDYFSTRTQYNAGAGWSGGAATVILREDSDEWVGFETKFTVESNAKGYYVSLQLYYTGSWAGTIQLKELKLEKGNKRTDWTPAPEDAIKDINAVIARMTSAETAINQNKDAIDLRATKTEVTQTLSGYYTKAQTDSAISVASNSITQTVSSTYATKTALNGLTDDFNNLSIGGRNLIAGTSKDEIALGGYPASSYSEGKTGKTIDIPNGDEYVLSFEAKSTVAGDKIVCHFYSPNTTTLVESSTGWSGTYGDGWAKVTLSTAWKRYWIKYAQNGAGTTETKSWIVGRRMAGEGTGSVSIRAIKLEAGNKATEWTPAPEDTKTEFATVRSEIKQLADSISLSVSGGLGSTASITLSANGTNTTKSFDMSKVRTAFANDTTAVTISAGKVTFNSGTIVINAGNFTLDASGNVTASNAVLNGTLTTIDGSNKAIVDSGGLELYANNNLYGFISSKHYPSAGNYCLALTVPQTGSGGLKFVAAATGALLGTSYVIYYDMQPTYDGIIEYCYDTDGVPVHEFVGSMRFMGITQHMYPSWFNSMIYLKNQACIGWTDARGGGPHQLISFDSSNVLNIGIAGRDTYDILLRGTVTLMNGWELRSKKASSEDTISMIYLGTSNDLIVGYGLPSSNTIRLGQTTRPNLKESYDLGTSSYKWRTIYSKNELNGSDRRLKKNISALSDIHSELFDKLQPVQYEFIDTLDRVYYGLIAQDVEASIVEIGIGADDLGLVQHDYYVDDTTGELVDEYCLGYRNFIAMLIHEVQKLKHEIKTLKGE